MSLSLIHPVILSGGAGTRLWPVSRSLHPKQLQALVTERTLLQETVLRAEGDGFAPPVVVCNDVHRFAIADQMRVAGVVLGRIIVEPVARNTAAAIAAAALVISENDPDALLLVLPSDHIIADQAGFRAAVEKAVVAARTGHLVAFGMAPDKAHTGYGYIRSGAALPEAPGAFAIDRFVEKPDAVTARGFLDEGGWSWNAGMFLLPARLLLQEIDAHRPEVAAAVRQSYDAAIRDSDFIKLDPVGFAASPPVSIDYAVMERTRHAAVVPATLGWSDIGAWSALWETGDQNADRNVTIGDVLTHGVSGSYLRSDGPLLAAVGIDDIVAVATHDAVLIASRDRAEDVKLLVTELTRQGREEVAAHQVVHRPWGTYRTLLTAPGFQVKHITVNPAGRLSLQKHAHRAEHWVVVAGTAKVTRDGEVALLKPKESAVIPIGMVHRLENPGLDMLHLVEVQLGDYLGEDDIVRLEDIYGRK